MADNGVDALETRGFLFLMDGLGDPAQAQALSGAVFRELALPARADPAGMWLEVESPGPMTEAIADQVALLAHRQGLDLRDRIGSDFSPRVTESELVKRLSFEWTSRLATALVFLVPALFLHYLTPRLATGGLLIPRFLEAVLVGWSLIAATWPVLYQAALALASLRMTPDLYAAALMLIAFAHGLFAWILSAQSASFFVTAYAILALALQRMLLWRTEPRRAGHAHLMLPTSRLLGFILLLGCALMPFDIAGAFAFLLAAPAMMGALSVNRLLPGFLTPFPILMFAFLLATAPWFMPALGAPGPVLGRVEAAFAFCVVISLLLGLAPPRTRQPR